MALRTGLETPKEKIKEWLAQIEPRMKSGLSLHKACLDADIPYTTLVGIMNRDDEVRKKIEYFRSYQSILFTNVFQSLYIRIAEKIKKGEEITDKEWERLKWLATHLPNTKKDYSDRTELTGPEGETLIIPDNKPSAEQLLNVFDAIEKIANKLNEESLSISEKTNS